MDIIFVLVPLSVVLVVLVMALLAWAVFFHQFDDIEKAGQFVLLLDEVQGPLTATKHMEASDFDADQNRHR
jgi:cbb3-type cytochrome oxidase maturation protein